MEKKKPSLHESVMKIVRILDAYSDAEVYEMLRAVDAIYARIKSDPELKKAP